MSELSYSDLKKMMRGRKHFEIIDFPGFPEVKIAVKILGQKELEDCARACDLVINKLKQDHGDVSSNSVYVREMERQVLFRSIMQVPELDTRTDEYNFIRFFPDADCIGEICTLDTVEMLMQAYNANQEKYSPAQTIKTAEDFENIIEEVKKNSIRGLSLSTHDLMTLVDILVKTPEILQKDSGSLSLPSKDSSQNTNEKLSKIKVKTEKVRIPDRMED